MIDFLKDNIWVFVIVLNYILVISAVTTILFKNINPTKTLSYIMVLVVFPYLGLIVYYFFGQEYRKNKIFNRKNVLNKNVVQKLDREYKLSKSQLHKLDEFLDTKMKLVKLMNNNKNTPVTLKNELQIIKNGKEKFKLLFEDLKQAKHHIHLEYYILKDDHIGTKLIDILCEKASEGIKVRLTFDDVGSKISWKTKRRLKDNGVEFYAFMPVLFPNFTGKMNYRNHRKIAIIDGEIGYVGGINIADAYVNYKDDTTYWRDTHLRIVGEALKPLQVHFLMTWDFVSNSSCDISVELFPNSDVQTTKAVQIAASGPDTDWANIMEAMFVAINTAENYVYVTTPYFIPNDEIVTALQVAAKSGIDVRLLIPKESDSWIAKYATNSYLERLLEAEVRVYRYTKGFIHAKTMVVDDLFSTIGTSNLDYRSFNINFEINALIYNKETSVELKDLFLDDILNSEELSLESWQKRSKYCKLKESYSRLWSPLL
ncbi:cardiolipin synthase [Bizionia argentinensis JUB59]|uniref:Cardiolipin synthase n=1 Tax=Bizionia argentinensis JUB59 TaxID=1046627 RepID=G2EC33_9FLAO|nr:cardiolipin synthase [Bizionia argentinensis]EGV44038.1 cardiolipin synthase [Bizionia argentinensis JUB59]